VIVVGVHDGHGSAAALVVDGKLVAAIQEERPRRVKNWQGFPRLAIEALLAQIGVTWKDVDAFVYAGAEYYRRDGHTGAKDRDAHLREYKKNAARKGELRRIARRTVLRDATQWWRRRSRFAALRELGVPRSKIHVVKHHMCHAMTAYYGRGRDPDALVVTLDGGGDGLCATISLPRASGDRRLELVASIDEGDSVGFVWAVITVLLDMTPMDHEYKLMGMAPYATGPRAREVADIFRAAFVLDTETPTFRRAPGVPESNYSYAYWRDKLEFRRFDNVCAGLQMFTEEFISAWLQNALRRTGCRKLRVSGGVFMNVKMNKIIAELPEVDDLWVFPSCGDETNAIGAAWGYLDREGLGDTIEPIGPFYLGIAPTDAELDAAAEEARRRGLSVTRPADMTSALTDILCANEPVARFAGREEFGARALGNRSLLANPRNAAVVPMINKAIKSRDFWMPFAPSVLAEEAHRYVDNPKGLEAPYMILAFDSKSMSDVIAACHPEDGTIRPQVVTREMNPEYHALLKAFGDRSGTYALLNTSFNLHGEPIVSKPLDALDVLTRSGLRHLALGPYLIQKG
jgi:carbamoyltransferase